MRLAVFIQYVALGKTQSPAPCFYLRSDWCVVWRTTQSCVTAVFASGKFLNGSSRTLLSACFFFFFFSPPFPHPPTLKYYILINISTRYIITKQLHYCFTNTTPSGFPFWVANGFSGSQWRTSSSSYS